MVGITWLPQNVHILMPETSEYAVTLYGERDFADRTKLRVLGLEDYPVLSK